VKTFVDWLLAWRPRLVILAIAVAPLVPLAAGALFVLETARRGLSAGLTSAALGIAGLVTLGYVSGADVVLVGTVGGLNMLGGVAVGAVVARTRSLTFAYQLVILACFALVVVGALVGPEPQVVFEPLLREFEVVMREQAYDAATLATLKTELGRWLAVVTLFSSLVGALLLGFWWWTLAEGEQMFGAQFRRLTLGRWLGIAATGIAVLGLAFGTALVQNLALLAWLAFMLQGLAVVHAVGFARRWHPGLLALLYVLFLPPLTVFVIVPVVVVGVLDTWLNLRARLRAA
jgi:hypothetical protein